MKVVQKLVATSNIFQRTVFAVIRVQTEVRSAGKEEEKKRKEKVKVMEGKEKKILLSLGVEKKKRITFLRLRQKEYSVGTFCKKRSDVDEDTKK